MTQETVQHTKPVLSFSNRQIINFRVNSLITCLHTGVWYDRSGFSCRVRKRLAGLPPGRGGAAGTADDGRAAVFALLLALDKTADASSLRVPAAARGGAPLYGSEIPSDF